MKPTYLSFNRRDFLKFGGSLSTLSLLGNSALLSGCQQPESLVRVATNVFPGYELLHLAAERKYFDDNKIRMLSMPSSTACLQALAAGNVEGAALTLDEVISARADNMTLKILAILDISLGADFLLARQPINHISQLKGKRIGVEQTAVGAVMLAAALEQAQLSINDVEITYATVNQHYDLFKQNKVDALVTFEPVSTQLGGQGFNKLFDSSQIPGLIVDVLVVRPEITEKNPTALRELLAGQFRALQDLRSQPQVVAPILAKRLGIKPEEVAATYKDLELPDATANHLWLEGTQAKLIHTLPKLQQLMLQAKLLRNPVNLSNLADARFLPARGSA